MARSIDMLFIMTISCVPVVILPFLYTRSPEDFKPPKDLDLSWLVLMVCKMAESFTFVFFHLLSFVTLQNVVIFSILLWLISLYIDFGRRDHGDDD